MKNLKKLVSLIETSESVVITSHENPDPDAVASMLLVRKLIKHISPDVKVCLLVDRITEKLKNISVRYMVEFTEKCPHADLGILVDTNSMNGFEKISDCKKKALIDHHISKPDFLELFDFYIVEERTTTCEILLDVFTKFDMGISRKEALLVLGAIVYDTVWLRIGGPRTYKVVYRLMRTHDIRMEEVYLWNFTEEDVSKTLAKIKAVRRGEIHKVNNFVTVFTHISSFLGYVSKELVLFGFDIAVVVGKKGDTVVSVKCSERLLEKEVNLVEWLKDTGIFYDFGGHAGAAGGRTKKSVEATLSALRKHFLKKLKEL